MKSLEQIKDEVAKKYDFVNWVTMYNLDEVSNAVIDEIAKEYAKEMATSFADLLGNMRMIKAHGGWFHYYDDQRNLDNLITTEQLYKEYNGL